LFEYQWLCDLQCLTSQAFPPFCWGSDVFSSSVDTLINHQGRIQNPKYCDIRHFLDDNFQTIFCTCFSDVVCLGGAREHVQIQPEGGDAHAAHQTWRPLPGKLACIVAVDARIFVI